MEIIESHHRYKKDAPSGTALKLAETICSATNQKMDDVVIYGRKALPEKGHKTKSAYIQFGPVIL